MKKNFGILISLFVAVLAIVSCGGGTNNNSNATPAPTITLSNSSQTFSTNELATASVLNFQLTGTTYQATIDGSLPISVARTSNTSLVWIIPQLPDGNHTLSISLGGNLIAVPFTVLQQTVPQTLDAILNQTLPSLTTAIDNEITTLSQSPGNEILISWLQSLKSDLANLSAQAATLTPQQQAELAALLYHNFINNRTSGKPLSVANAGSACDNSQVAWRLSAQIIGIDIGMVVAGISLAPATAGWSGLVSVYGLAQFIKDLRTVKMATETVITQCVTNQVDFITADAIQKPRTAVKRAAGAALSLTCSVPKLFTITSRYALTDATLLSDIQSIASKIMALPRSLLPTYATTYFSTIQTEQTKTSDAATYSISNISDSNISGTASSVSGKLQLVFSFLQPPATSPVNFTFRLTDSRDGHSTTTSAILTANNSNIASVQVTNLNGSWITRSPVDTGGTTTLQFQTMENSGIWSVATGTNVLWTSEDSTIATVVNGVVSGVHSGVTHITATHVPSGLSDSISVVVGFGAPSMWSLDAGTHWGILDFFPDNTLSLNEGGTTLSGNWYVDPTTSFVAFKFTSAGIDYIFNVDSVSMGNMHNSIGDYWYGCVSDKVYIDSTSHWWCATADRPQWGTYSAWLIQ